MLSMTRGNGKMTFTINREDYFKLLQEIQLVPKVIETETEYEQNLAVAEKLIAKKKNRSFEETTLLRLLVKLIEDYEETNYHLKEWQDLPPHEILQHLLEVSHTKQADLVGIISPSKGLISAIVNGKRAISKEQAKKLGEYFKISPSLFI
jgi:HTH-type transcriptional regulator / antitoxin HigA